jgi:HEAT repeat protein
MLQRSINSLILLLALFAISSQAITNDLTLERIFRRAVEHPRSTSVSEQSRAAVQELKDWGPTAIPFLCAKLEHPCLPGVFTIQEIITHWKSNAVPGLLACHAATTNVQARRIIVYYLGLIRDPRGRPAAEQELGNVRNRSTALWALGRCGITDAVPWATEIIVTGVQQMARVRSAGILRRLGDERHCPTLAHVLASDTSWNVRCAAARALAAHGAAGCTAITSVWDSLSTSGKILGLHVIAESTNFASAEVLKLYTYDSNPYAATHAADLCEETEPAPY